MARDVKLQPAKLATMSADRTACLLFLDGELAAVMVRLDDDGHGLDQGCWFLEVGFGPCEGAPAPIFPTMGAAQAWVLDRYA